MKSVYSRLLVIVFCFTFVSIGFSQDSALKEKFQKMNNEMVKAILDENTDVVMSMYTDDAISMPSYEPMLKGKKAMLESQKRSHEAGFKMNDMTLKTMEVWSSGDYAYEVGNYSVDMEIPGMGNMNDNGKYLTVWEKQSDGSWKVKVETWNTDNNPWADMNMDEMDSDQ